MFVLSSLPPNQEASFVLSSLPPNQEVSFCSACLLIRRCLLFCHPQVDDVGSNASWRTRPKTHIQLIADIISRGLSVSPLFAVPWVTSSIFRVDWLHCADLGVAADYLGNLFWSALPKLPGRSRKERVSVLWGEVQAFYKTYNVCDKLYTAAAIWRQSWVSRLMGL